MRRLHPLVSEQAENLVPEILSDIFDSSEALQAVNDLNHELTENEDSQPLEVASAEWRHQLRGEVHNGPQTSQILDADGVLHTVWDSSAIESAHEILNAPLSQLLGASAPLLDPTMSIFFDAIAQENPPEEVGEIVPNELELTPEQLASLEAAVEEAHQEIPLNSPTLLITETTSRFSSALWYEKIQEKKILLAGLGGIGSYVGFLLARMQPESLVIYDDDKVEMANLSGQFYGTTHIGQLKSSALASIMADFSNFRRYVCFPQKYTVESSVSDIMICGFDNMAARKTFFDKWCNHVATYPLEERGKCLFIDGRLSAEYLQIFCLRGDDSYFISKYNAEQLFSDKEADGTICSYKQTSFMANMIASLMVNLFVNFVANQCDPLIPRDVPYLTEYTGETMFFNTIQ